MNINYVNNYLNKYNSKPLFIDNQSIFSNNYVVKFKIPQNSQADKLVEFSTVSQAFAYLKANYFKHPELFNDILQFDNTRQVADKLNSLTSDSWNKDRVRIMIIATFYKYRDNPDLLNKLLGINHDLPVFIGNSKYWTIGINSANPNPRFWLGDNHLGEVLLKVRSMLIPKGNSDDQIY